MLSTEFIGKWQPATSGERLLHFIAREVVPLRVTTSTIASALGNIPRGESFALFFQGSIVLHSFARLMQAAKHFRDEYRDDPKQLSKRIREFATDRLNIERSTCAQFERLAPLAVEAAENSTEATKRTKPFRNQVINEARGAVYCYSCGGSLNPSLTDQTLEDYMDIEHIWPHSMGGDTVLDNLIQVCKPCNSNRKHLASWEWSRVQAPVQGSLGKSALDSDQLEKEEKIALHVRAAIGYARIRGCNLKTAYQSIGSRLSAVRLLDAADNPDFFNLYTHDAERSGVTWGELL